MLLMEKGKSLSDLRDEVKAYFKRQGYIKAKDKEEASFEVRLYGSAQDSWIIMETDYGAGENSRLIKRMSKDLKRKIVQLANEDSDTVRLPLTDGKEKVKQKPFFECRYKEAKKWADFAKSSDLPALQWDRISSSHNPIAMGFEPIGGEGEGVDVEIRIDGLDANMLEAAWVRLRFVAVETEWLKTRSADMPVFPPAEERYQYCIPSRCVFQDGAEGWIAHFPDAYIPRGINPSYAAGSSANRDKWLASHGIICYVLLSRRRGQPFVKIDWAMPPKVRIRLVPIENRTSGADEGKASYTDPELSRVNMFFGEEGKLIEQHCGEN